jgi:ABC-type spermidine/putrescine transport system permease subunit II
MNRGRIATKLAGASLALLGVGFGVNAVWAFAHLQRTGELPMTPFGFRAFEGPLTRLGTQWTSLLGAVLAAVCSLDVLAGFWLWRGERRGLRLATAAALPGLVLGAGFELPFLLLGLPLSLLLALAGRRTLR